MERAIPEFVDIPVPAVSCWTTAHADVHWANLTSPLRLLDWEAWGRAPEGFDAATLYAYSLLQTVSRGDNLALADPLRAWSEELRRR
ncbi:hypothetical protein [Streptomyces sp. NPDC051677]|uniref:hypothetical protein n=1 Tax=Streptomyces sp. NPDC051677 TaxID=3365669 RepID=UPI0037D2BFD5